MNRFLVKIENLITRFIMWLLHEDPAKHGMPVKPKKIRYPRNMESPPVYVRTPVTNEEMDILAYVHRLSCPICGTAVKRSDSYCRGCGDHLVEAK